MGGPIINLDEIHEFDDMEENGFYTSKRHCSASASARGASAIT